MPESPRSTAPDGPGVLFEFDRVAVTAGDRTILHDLDATVAESELTVLLGPSGAGKSTMLRLCNRFEIASSGTVRFRGDDVRTIDPLALRRRVGMVFQRPTMFEGTVADNLRIAEPTASDADIAAQLGRVALPAEMAHRDASVLSGGEAQRACLARTLLTRPDVLLLDEPTSALDPASTRQLEQTIAALVDDGMSVLWVTHQLDQVDRIDPARRIVLVDGRPATPHEIDHYLHAEPLDHDETTDHERTRRSDGDSTDGR